MTLIAAHNWGLTESCIDKNWKLDDWIDKTESWRTEMKKVKIRRSVLHFCLKNINIVCFKWYFITQILRNLKQATLKIFKIILIIDYY